MKSDDKTALFQARLLELLASPLSASQTLEMLKQDPDCLAFRNYIDSFDLDMLAVAKELVKKWGEERA